MGNDESYVQSKFTWVTLYDLKIVYLAIRIDKIFYDPLAFYITRRDGETGRHAGFKIQWPRGRAGSIPALGTS